MNTGGTHMGKLDPDARARRRIKNQRNASRTHPKGFAHSLDMPVPGSQKVVAKRLYAKGNRRDRGLS